MCDHCLDNYQREKLLVEVRKTVATLLKDKYDRLSAELRDLLLQTWNGATKELIAEILRMLNGPDDFDEDDLQRILARVQERMGAAFANQVAAPMFQIHEATYLAGLTDVTATATFQLIDTAAVDMLNRHNIFWVRDFTDSKIFPRVASLGADIIKQGLSREAAGKLLQSGLQGTVGDYGIYYFKGFSNHVVTRARELGRVESYVRAGVEYLRIVAVMDDRTTPICASMHNRIIPVSKAVALRDKLIAAETPEDVKTIAPWLEPDDVDGKDSAKLPVGMSLPPYHWNCRTRTVKARKKDFENDPGYKPE